MNSTEPLSPVADVDGPVRRARSSLVLVVAAVAILIVPMGVSGTPILLPQIGADLGGSLVGLQWVVNAYNVAAASFMLVTGVLADQYGRRRVFRLGAGLYFLSLLVTIVSPSTAIIDVARAAAGIGAGAIVTSMTAIVANEFEGAARARAFSVVGVVIGAGLALGPTVSGAISQLFDWRTVFVLHAVIVGAALLGSVVLRESRNPGKVKFDVVGAVIFTGGLLLLTVGTIEGPRGGWLSPLTIGLFAGAALALVAFVAYERRVVNPMFDLSLFANRQFLTVNLVNVQFAFGFIGLLLLLPAFLSGVGGLGDGATGVRILFLTAPIFVAPLLSGRLLAAGIDLRYILAGSLAAMGIGAFGLTFLDADSALWVLALPLILTGLGVGSLNGVMDGAAVSTVPNESSGMAAGVFNTIRLAAEALASVLVVALLASFTQARLTEAVLPVGLDPAHATEKLASGDVRGLFADFPEVIPTLTGATESAFTQVMWISVGLAAVSVVAVLVLLHRQRDQ